MSVTDVHRRGVHKEEPVIVNAPSPPPTLLGTSLQEEHTEVNTSPTTLTLVEALERISELQRQMDLKELKDLSGIRWKSDVFRICLPNFAKELV